MDAWILNLATTSVAGFLCYVMIVKTLPDMMAKFTAMMERHIEECRDEKAEIRKAHQKDIAADRANAAELRKRDSDRFNRLHEEIKALRRGTVNDGETAP